MAETLPTFHRSTDDVANAPAPKTALMARFADRSHTDRRDNHPDRREFRPLDRHVPRPDVRRDPPPDARSASRQDDRSGVPRSISDSRSASHFDDYREVRTSDDSSNSSVTLADIQKSFTTLQSHLDKHTRQAAKTASPRRDRASPPPRDRAAYNTHVEDNEPAAYTTIMDDDDELDPSLHVRQTWGSYPRPF
jgi:hypothetical protein